VFSEAGRSLYFKQTQHAPVLAVGPAESGPCDDDSESGALSKAPSRWVSERGSASPYSDSWVISLAGNTPKYWKKGFGMVAAKKAGRRLL